MEATAQMPEGLAQRLERLADEEGTSVDDLIRLMLSEHAGRRRCAFRRPPGVRKEVRFSLISLEETGVIQPVSGADLDDMSALDDLAS
jgi:hypothetical protein